MKTNGSLLMSIPIISTFGGKIWLGYVTCKSPTTSCLESPTPICLFTIQLSWATMKTDERPHYKRFWRENMAGSRDL